VLCAVMVRRVLMRRGLLEMFYVAGQVISVAAEAGCALDRRLSMARWATKRATQARARPAIGKQGRFTNGHGLSRPSQYAADAIDGCGTSKLHTNLPALNSPKGPAHTLLPSPTLGPLRPHGVRPGPRLLDAAAGGMTAAGCRAPALAGITS
jgi:hypothetical protein